MLVAINCKFFSFLTYKTHKKCSAISLSIRIESNMRNLMKASQKKISGIEQINFFENYYIIKLKLHIWTP